MGDVMDSTLMHINKGNAHGTQRERTQNAKGTHQRGPKTTLFHSWVSLGLFENYFSLKSLSLSFKSHMNVPLS